MIMKIKDIEKVNDFKDQLFQIQLFWVALVIAMSLFGFYYGFLYTTMGFQFPPEGMPAYSVFLFSLVAVLVVLLPVGGSWLLIKRMNQLFSRLNEPNLPVVEDATT